MPYRRGVARPSPLASRRALLRGAGATLALPWLGSWAEARGETAAPPVRLGFFFMPNGVLPSAWQVQGEGASFQLSSTLAPLEPHRRHLTVLSGLRNKNSLSGEGHYVKTTALLSGAPVRKTGGRDLRVGTTIDQVAAQQRGHLTPLPSLELSLEPVRNIVDMGYSTVYGAHISWSAPDRPVPRERRPQAVFDRLYRASSLGADPRHASILDLVRGEARSLKRRVSSEDGEKVSEYLEGVRTLEQRVVAFAERAQADRLAVAAGARPERDLPDAYPAYARLMLELLAQAFITDTTRVASLMWGNAVSGRSFSFLDEVSSGFHSLSHHEKDPAKQSQYARINRWHIEELAWLADRLAAVPEGPEGETVLDHCALLFCSGLRDGNAHSPHDLPIAVVGGASGALRTGQHLASPMHTPLCHVYVDLLRAFGAPVARFGDAEGGLPGLSA
jgi:hypothetical protein